MFARNLARPPLARMGIGAANADDQRSIKPHAAPAFPSLVADIVHEFRNPLSALSGETEVALRRERSVAEYRQALERIAQQVSELVALTSDIALLAEPRPPARIDVGPLDQAELLAGVTALSASSESVLLGVATPPVHVLGDARRLSRALVLLVEHALRHRHRDAVVRLRTLPAEQGTSSWVRLVLDATPSGFVPRAWRHLAPGAEGELDGKPGQLRVRFADRFIEQCGGTLSLAVDGGSEVIEVTLPRVRDERPAT